MDLRLKDKTALVTGASMGIGRAIAAGLAAEGVQLCIAARRKSLLEELAREIVAAGGSHPTVVEVDMMPEGAPSRLTRDAFDALGHIDILVNCAGGSQPPIPIDAIASITASGSDSSVIGTTQDPTSSKAITPILSPG